MGFCFKGESPIASVTKKGNKSNHQQQLYCTHGTFVQELEILKISCMFTLSIWKFYYKLMTNQLPVHFTIMKPSMCSL